MKKIFLICMLILNNCGSKLNAKEHDISPIEINVEMQLSAIAPAGTSTSFEASIVDSLGIFHLVTFTLVKQSVPNRWHLTQITPDDESDSITALTLPIELAFSNIGALYSIGTPQDNGTENPAGIGEAVVKMTMTLAVDDFIDNQPVTLKLGRFGTLKGVTQNGPEINSTVLSVWGHAFNCPALIF